MRIPGTLLAAAVLLSTLCAAPAAHGDVRPAAQSLARCVQTTGSLSAVVLMDESGSLKVSDRSSRRVEGLKAAFAGLARLANEPLGSRRRLPKVEVTTIGFSGGVSPDPGAKGTELRWERASDGNLDRLVADANRYAARNDGEYTDYRTALGAARRALAERAGQLTGRGGSPPCKALFFFTDGGYKVRGGPTAIRRGTDAICRRNGLMDGLESDGVVRFVVGLSLRSRGRDLLRSIATGEADDERCGSRLNDRTGTYVDVRDSAELFFAFGALLGDPGTPLPDRPVCPLRPCGVGSSSFTTLAGLRGFLIRAVTGGERIQIVLQGPDGDSATLRPGRNRPITVSGARVRPRWVSKRAVEFEAALPAGLSAWKGSWSFAFVDPSGRERDASPVSRIQLFSDIVPALAGRPALVRGAPTNLRMGFRLRGGGRPPSGQLLEGTRLAVRIRRGSAAQGPGFPVVLTKQAADSYGGTVTLPARIEDSFVYLDGAATFRSVRGISVAPEQRSYELRTRLPASGGYPQVAPAEVHPPSVEGDGSSNATLRVTASRDADGCVWIGPQRGEPRIETTTVPRSTTADGCFRVRRGSTRKLEVRFSVAGRPTGTVNLTLPVRLRSSISRETRTVGVPVSFEVYPPPDLEKRAAILIALTLLGLLLPLGLLWGLNIWGARLAPPQLLRGLVQDVTLSPEGELHAPDGSALKTRWSDLPLLDTEGPAKRERRLDIDEFEVRAIAARGLRDLFRGPFAVVRADGERIVVGTRTDLRETEDPTEHEVPLGVAGIWIFRPVSPLSPSAVNEDDPDRDTRPAVRGRLALLVADHGDIDDGARLLVDAGLALESAGLCRWAPSTPSLLERLRAALPSRRRREPRTKGGVEPDDTRGPSDTDDGIGDNPHDY